MKNPYKTFETSCGASQDKIAVVLVNPEQAGNIGATARAMANMGIAGPLVIIGKPELITGEAEKFAKHAKPKLEQALFFNDLVAYFASLAQTIPQSQRLSIAATARIGSAKRPHPTRVRPAMVRAMNKLKYSDIQWLSLVFGPEASGLTNADLALCDWVVTIPSLNQYRSLNLAQSVLIFCYEANMAMLEEWEDRQVTKPTSRGKLVQHLLQVAEEVGFILPNDPFKMRPKLEEIFSGLPNHIKDIKTLHGLLDQVRRSIRKGEPDFKGRYKRLVSEGMTNGEQEGQ